MAIVASTATSGESQPKPNGSSSRPRRHSTRPTTEIEAAPSVARQPTTVQTSRWPRSAGEHARHAPEPVAVRTSSTPRRRADFSPGTGKPPVRLRKSPAMIGVRARSRQIRPRRPDCAAARPRGVRGAQRLGGGRTMLGGEFGAIASTANIAFLLAFPSLFSIINPIGGALIFSVYTRAFAQPGSAEDRRARRPLFARDHVLRPVGRRLRAEFLRRLDRRPAHRRRNGGGAQRLAPPELGRPAPRPQDQRRPTRDGRRRRRPEAGRLLPAHPALHHGPRHDRGGDHARRGAAQDGPRALAFFLGVTLAAIANAAIIWIAYRFADRLTAAMGATARQVVVRLSAFLLVCIGVQILVTAVGDLVREWRVA